MNIQKPYILITNRMMPKKRFEYAIKAMPYILKKFSPLNMVITGRINHYTDDLKKIAKILGVDHCVVFTDYITDQEIDKLYLQAAVYVYTAPEEDYGKGMVEAMAAAVPVVAWDNAGPTGIVKNGITGYLAQPFEVEDMADKITRLLLNKALNRQMGLAGRERVKKGFTKRHHQLVLEREIKRAISQLI